ncbi:MAG: aminotransferase class I/II-fold pyridoxal phosphate-dependent enzyme [Bacteroidetes bacterium]|nr:aminotransferase class I/II-fold pyridoxal phosphate-dependent enzyme [Bacteroidota bacterium]
MKKETKAIRTQAGKSIHNEHSVPLYLTSSFLFENAEHGRALFADEIEGNIYSRFSNPNTSEFVLKMAELENAEDGFAFASGMAAVFAGFASLLSKGDHILSSRSLFGSTHQILTKILPKWGIEFTYVDADKPEQWEDNIRENTKMIFAETPSNPGLEIIDLEFLGKLKKKHNLILNVDNCFATPYLQTPIDYGADLVTHSATKYIDGQGRVIGGVIVGNKELIKEIRYFARQTGPSLSPFNAWILSKSLETLSIRMEKHCSNAFELAKIFEGNSELELVKYPMLASHPQYELSKKQMKMGGGIVTLILKGGYDRARNFIDALNMASKTANLGDTRTIITHPASTTHSKLTDDERKSVGIYPGTVRVSVGLENINDIIEDITQALQKSK